MTDLAEIGRNIVLLRNVQELTQEEVAYRSQLSVNRLQAIEHGCQNTTVDTLIRVAGTFGIDSRVFGIFTRTDDAIITEFRQAPRLPVREGGPLQICGNILLLRKMMGWTQRELACRSHMSVACLRGIEQGYANMTVSKLLYIAAAFGLSLAELNNLTTSEEDLMESVYAARKAAGIERAGQFPLFLCRPISRY